MKHPLEQKIIALRRDVRQMAVLYGMCIVAMALLGMLVAWGLLDYLFCFQDRGLRIIASLSVFGVYAWTLYRCVLVVLWTPLGSVDLALRVQRNFPHLGDRLASAIEFLHTTEDDPAAGSATLRRAVVDQATAEAKPLNFAAVLDWRPIFRASTVMIVAYLPACLILVLNPSATGIAVTRLVHPLGDTAWPRANHLMVRCPVERIARGQAFQIEVVDAWGARLPPEVRIHYRFDGPDAVAVEETERMRYVDGVMTARRENVLRPFAYRVEGGDDRSMSWTDVQVVEPPAVESVAVRLIPPAYSGWPPMPAGRHIRALVGTDVQITGKATRPLRSALLCFDGGTRIPTQLSEDGCAFTVNFTVKTTGSYWFELTDCEGLGGSDDRWEIRAIPDAPPTVNIERPAANLFVTPQAVVPLRVAAGDDLAVRAIALVFAQKEKGRLPLWTSAGVPRSKVLAEGEGSPEPDRRTIDYRWDLGPLDLKPGTLLTFYATASDYLPQTGKSEPRILTVVSPEDLQNRIADREKLIRAELERVLKMQRGCRSQVESLKTRLAEQRRLGQAEVDHLQAVEHNQSEVDQALTSRGEGVPMHILALLADLENNRIASKNAQRRMTGLLEEIDRLGREVLPVIGRELTGAVKTAQVALEGQGSAVRSDQQAAASLASAGKHQDDVIASLEQMVGRLTQWDSYRRFPREIGQLLREQEGVSRRTTEVGRRTLTQEPREIAPQDAAELKDVAGRQLELARLLDRILLEMDQSGRELQRNDPSVAKTVGDALDRARRLATSGLMLAVGQQIQRNQIGQATAGQKQIDLDLREILDILAARPHQPNDETTAQDLGRMEEGFKQIRGRQQNAWEETKRLDGLVRAEGELTRTRAVAIHELALQQHAIHDDAARLGQQFAATGPLADVLRGAATDMDKAGTLLDGRETGPPAQEVQKSAIGRLDLLIEAVKSAKSNSSNASQSHAPTGSTPPKPGSADGQQPGNAPAASQLPQPSRDAGRKPKGDDMRAVMKRLWGRLPERARQQMLQLPGEEFSPKYEILIEEYYRRLAEENDE